MKFTIALKSVLLTSLALGCYSVDSALAQSQFTETALDQSKITAIARPYGQGKYDLLVIEQVPNKKQCWSESGAAPVLINPLLLNFDFTGHCRRSTDSNGYSVRLDGTDYGLEYLFRLVPRGNELVLVATSRSGKLPELVVGSTQGLASGFMKIILYPGWQFTKRTYGNKPLGHFYFSGSQANIQFSPSGGSSPKPLPTNQPPVEPVTPVTPVVPVEPVKPSSSVPNTSPSVVKTSTENVKPMPTTPQGNNTVPPKKTGSSINQFRKPY